MCVRGTTSRKHNGVAATLFAGLLAAGTADLTAAHGYGSRAAYGAATAECRTNPGVHSFPLGEATFTVLNDGVNPLPANFVFVDSLEVIKRVIKFTDVRTFGAPEDPLPLRATVGLLEYKGLKVLVDAGGGGFIEEQGLLPAQLEVLGLEPSDIDHILITHGHFDHVGGLIVDPESDELQFPNAKVHMAKEELEYWFTEGLVLTWGNPAHPPEMHGIVIDIARNALGKIPEDKLVLFSEGDEILPGITADRYLPWHTPGSTVFKILPEGAPQAVYAIGDAVGMAGIGLEAPWVRSAYDDRAELGPAGKYRLLDDVVADGGWVYGYHAPFPSVAAVVQDGIAYRGVTPVPEPGIIGLTCTA